MLRLVPLPGISPMATKAKSAVSRQPSRPRGRSTRRGNAVLAVLRWAVRTARPRSVSEVATLALAALGVTIGLLEAGLALSRGRDANTAVLLTLLLLTGAFVARTWVWWRLEAERMTWGRARNLLGCALLIYCALALAWHSAAASLGVGPAYPLPSVLGREPLAAFTLVVIALMALALLLRAPVGSWTLALGRAGRSVSTALRSRRLLESTSIDAADEGFWIPDEPGESGEVCASTEGVRVSGPGALASSARADSLVGQVAAPGGEASAPGSNTLPPIATFLPSPKRQAAPSDLDVKAQRIQETLASFNVSARVVDYHCGPVVTQFDVQPDRGVKVKSITVLQNDLALALAAPTIRIQAPVPGKPVIGIEIPNSTASAVSLRELLESEPYRAAESPLRIALGKDVSGTPTVIDLARMPHLLIAGATGSGKSVCINALISCLLYQNTPNEVRLMMVDPKTVELAVYNGVPHLLSPVITEMDRVVGVLQWALREMERRYQLFADNTVRNIQRYNEKAAASGGKPLPYIVFVIDELADLMMVSPEEVEDSICRLAQLARAAGIHLVIATQRPSVDVITGLIKANFPARIAFMMTSQIDSRTILDTAGAEKLLGRGDMLYLPPDAPKPIRLQGASVSEPEIERLVEFWKRSPMQNVVHRVPAEEFAEAEKAAQNADDELLSEAIRVVREYQHASVSLLQRKLRIGYSRAARVMDQLEAHGVVGPPDGSKQRPVLEDGFGSFEE